MKKLLTTLIIAASLSGTISSAFATVSVEGYFRSNGTYVMPHFRSAPDGIPYNNFNYRW